MTLCYEQHEEVCYESRCCPVCELQTEMDDKIEKLDNTIEELRTEVSDLEALKRLPGPA